MTEWATKADDGTTQGKQVSPIGRAIGFVTSGTGFARHPRTSPVWRWWKPLITVPLACIYFIILLAIVLIAGIATGMYTQMDVNNLSSSLEASQSAVFFSPLGAVLVIGGLGLMTLATALALWTSRERPFGTILSVFGRPRLGMFAKALVFSSVVVLLSAVVQTLIENPGGFPSPHPVSVEPWIIGVLVVALPLQCLAEEIVFRGYAMQTVASWLPKRVAVPIAIAAQAVLFMLGHEYDLPGQLSILVSGIIWGWVAEKTGGLETSTAFHVANNGIVFAMMGLGFTNVSSSIPVVEAAIDITTNILMPVAFVILGTRLGWIGDEATMEAGASPCRMFGSQRDAIMWEHIQEEQLKDWNRFINQMPSLEDQSELPLPYDQSPFIDGEGTIVGIGNSQYDDDQIVSLIDTGAHSAVTAGETAFGTSVGAGPTVATGEYPQSGRQQQPGPWQGTTVQTTDSGIPQEPHGEAQASSYSPNAPIPDLRGLI